MQVTPYIFMARLYSNTLLFGKEIKPKSGRKYFTTEDFCKIFVQPESYFLELVPIGCDVNKHDSNFLEPTYALVDSSKIWDRDCLPNFRFPNVFGDVLILSRNELEEFYLIEKESTIDLLMKEYLKCQKE